MARVVTTWDTNKPFTVGNDQIEFWIPDGECVRPVISVDGTKYEDIFGWIWGGQHVILSCIPCSTYIKLRSLKDFKIKILK